MKKIMYFAAMMAVVVSFASCGSSKKAQTTVSEDKSDLTKILEWVNSAEKGKLRAFGTDVATVLDEQSAYSSALRKARFEIASALQTEFDATFVDYTKQYLQTAIGRNDQGEIQAQAARDKDASSENEIVTTIKGFVQGAVSRQTIRTEKNGAVTYYVGVETDIEDIVKYLSKSEKVTKLISQQDKDRIDESRAKFEEMYRQRLEDKKSR